MDNEKEFLEKLKSGDTKAFEQMVSENQNNIYRIAITLLKNEHDAEDLTQEVLIRIYTAIKKFNGNSSLSTWIYRITYNLSLDFLTKNGKKRKLVKTLDDPEDVELLSLESDSFIPEKEFERKNLREDIFNALSQLPEEQRELIELKDVHGFSYEEILQMTGIKDGTLKSRLNRGRLSLKKKLIKKWNL